MCSNHRKDAVEASHQQNKTKASSNWRRLVPSLMNVFLLVFLITSILMNGALKPPTRRGFFCNDISIQYPFKSDTISFKFLMVIALFMPSLVIKALERKLSKTLKLYTHSAQARFRKDSDVRLEETKNEGELLMSLPVGDTVKRRLVVNDDNNSDPEALEGADICDSSDDKRATRSDVTIRDIESMERQELDESSKKESSIFSRALEFRRAVRDSRNSFKSFSDLQLFYFGSITTIFLTGVGKMTCGRLRPHFMERCKPNVDCTLPSNLYRYIVDFECTDSALGSRGLSYITTSWPSGHASIMFFAMLYLILYTNTVISTLVGLRCIKRPSRLGFNPLYLYFIYVLLIGLAIFVALTRVADYHHHPLDVLSGCVLGTIMALVISSCIMRPRFQPLISFLRNSSLC